MFGIGCLKFVMKGFTMVNNIHKLNEEKRRFKIAGILAFFATAPFLLFSVFRY